MPKSDVIGNALWALIWYSCGMIPKTTAAFHVERALRVLHGED